MKKKMKMNRGRRKARAEHQMKIREMRLGTETKMPKMKNDKMTTVKRW